MEHFIQLHALIPLSSPAKPAATVLSPTRPFVCCVRRELWENRSVYLAPLAVAGVVLFGFVISATAGIWTSPLHIDPTASPDKLADPYGFAAAFVLGTAFIVSFFYSIDCLYGERRDRSILFWKSLPVSDLTTVLSKAFIPLVFLPCSPMRSRSSLNVSCCCTARWSSPLADKASRCSGRSYICSRCLPDLLFHIVTVHMLWYTPIYAWLLLVSAWAPPRSVPLGSPAAGRHRHL